LFTLFVSFLDDRPVLAYTFALFLLNVCVLKLKLGRVCISSLHGVSFFTKTSMKLTKLSLLLMIHYLLNKNVSPPKKKRKEKKQEYP